VTKLVKEVLKSIFESYDDWRFKLLKNWDVCIGPVSAHVRLERICQDVLVLGVYDRIWMHELYALSYSMVASINEALGGAYIRELKFCLVERSRVRHHVMHSTPLQRTTRERQLASNERKALDRISDPQLKEVLHAFLMRISETAHGQ